MVFFSTKIRSFGPIIQLDKRIIFMFNNLSRLALRTELQGRIIWNTNVVQVLSNKTTYLWSLLGDWCCSHCFSFHKHPLHSTQFVPLYFFNWVSFYVPDNLFRLLSLFAGSWLHLILLLVLWNSLKRSERWQNIEKLFYGWFVLESTNRSKQYRSLVQLFFRCFSPPCWVAALVWAIALYQPSRHSS